MPVDEVTNAAEIPNDSLSNVVSRSRAIVSKIKRSSALQVNICRIQEVLKKPPFAVVLENNTRWNSFHDMLKRLIELKEVLTLAMPDDFEDFNWKAIENVCKLLQPLKEATMASQEKSADAKLAVRVIKYLKVIASSETVLESPVNDVMQKWNNGNIIVNALLLSVVRFMTWLKAE